MLIIGKFCVLRSPDIIFTSAFLTSAQSNPLYQQAHIGRPFPSSRNRKKFFYLGLCPCLPPYLSVIWAWHYNP